MVPAAAQPTGKTASLLDVRAQLDMELYMHLPVLSMLAMPVVSEKSRSVINW